MSDMTAHSMPLGMDSGAETMNVAAPWTGTPGMCSGEAAKGRNDIVGGGQD